MTRLAKKLIIGIVLIVAAANIAAVCFSHREGGQFYNILGANAFLMVLGGVAILISSMDDSE